MKPGNIKNTTDKSLAFKCSKIKEDIYFVFHEHETINFISKSLLGSIMRKCDVETVEVNIDEYVRVFEDDFTLSDICEYIKYRTNLKRFEGYKLEIKVQ